MEHTDAPVIGRIAHDRSLARSGASLVWDDPRLVAPQENFRSLRTNIQFLSQTDGSVLQVTSADARQGKSTVVANLGVALAQVGVWTLIVDADLRRPRQHEIFGLDNDTGLSTLLADPSATVAPQPTVYKHLSILPAGPIPPNSTEMVHVRFASALAELRTQGGVILVDSAPLLPISDARLIARNVDGVVLVVGANREKPAAVRGALELLQLANATLLGTVLNHSSEDVGETGEYGYRHHEASVLDRTESAV